MFLTHLVHGYTLFYTVVRQEHKVVLEVCHVQLKLAVHWNLTSVTPFLQHVQQH